MQSENAKQTRRRYASIKANSFIMMQYFIIKLCKIIKLVETPEIRKQDKRPRRICMHFVSSIKHLPIVCRPEMQNSSGTEGGEITTSNLESKFRNIVSEILTDQHGNLGSITYRHLEFTLIKCHEFA